MQTDMEQLYQERLRRYVTAMRNGKPDRIPIRPFVAEFTAVHAGMTCQEVTHDYEKAFLAARKCAADYDWDAVVGNMVYVWTGLTQALGTKYYGIPGIDVAPETGFQYKEPPEDESFMRPDEYDQLIADPTGFLFNTWLPRTSTEVGGASAYRNNLAFVKGGMAMLSYFNAFGPQGEMLRKESGTVGAISGIFKAPFDIIADKLRGYMGLTMDLIEQPDKVMGACHALMPHLLHMALSGADPDKNVPIGFWMHRGCVPFITQEQYDNFFWPTLKPIIEEIWAQGHQVLFYAEGDWTRHLESFAELPEQSIVFHLDRTNPRAAADILGKKFCLSGGIPNYLLSYGTPDEVRAKCREIIDIAAPDGGYIMDASAIVQNDAKVENVRALTEFTREYGNYGCAAPEVPELKCVPPSRPGAIPAANVPPGACLPWSQKRAEIPVIRGDEELARQIWENVDALGYLFIWHCLLSF